MLKGTYTTTALSTKNLLPSIPLLFPQPFARGKEVKGGAALSWYFL
jgi:hypothetical protein